MITFLVDAGEAHAGVAVAGVPLERVNWWTHMLVILAFTVLIPDSKHLHLLLSPATVFLRAPILGTVPKLDFEKEQTGLETVGQLEKKQVLDAFTCVECGRCQENCPAFATGKVLNPKKLILQNEEALLAGKLELPLKDLYDDPALWQCTTCGACQNECPVGVEHLPLIVNARRGLVSNGEAPSQLVPVYNHLERRGNIWGLLSEQRQKFIDAAGVEIFDPVKHDYVVWLGCAGAFEADFQKSLRALFDILRAKGVRFGVLAKEKCNGDVAKRTGNEYLFQELATSNVDDLKDAGVKKVDHVLPALPEDARPRLPRVRLRGRGRPLGGVRRGADPRRARRSPVSRPRAPSPTTTPAISDATPASSTSRGRCSRGPAPTVTEPERTKTNPFCCGAGGGLLFEEHEAGQRISDARYRAAGGDRRRHRGDGLPVLLDHAEGRPGQRREVERGHGRRRRQDDGDDRPDVLRRRSPARRPRRRGGRRRSAARDPARRSVRRAGVVSAPAEPAADWRASRSKRLQARLIPRLVAPIAAALGATYRYRIEGLEPLDAMLRSGDPPPIMVFWHGRILPATLYFRHRGIVVVTSANFDGEWIAGVIRRFGYGAARGSSSRGGARALVELRRAMAQGHAAGFTLDGPRGPARVAQPGAVFLSQITGSPLVPFHLEASKAWTAKSWDRTQVPKPGATVSIVVGEPYVVTTARDDAGREAACRDLEARLAVLEARALALLGLGSPVRRPAAAGARGSGPSRPGPPPWRRCARTARRPSRPAPHDRRRRP